MVSKGVIIGIVIGAVVLIAIIIVVVVILLRRRAAANKDRDGGNGGPLPGTTCSTNDDCASGACDTGPGLCVECLENADCGESLPLCKTETKTCEECLVDTDCDPGVLCVSNACCTDEAPVIVSITSETDNDSSFTVTYTRKQPVPQSSLLLILEDPDTGLVLGKPTCFGFTSETCADDGDCVAPCTEFSNLVPSVKVTETALDMKLWPGQEYQARIQIKYKCGSNTFQFSEMSEPFQWTQDACPEVDTPLIFAMVADPLFDGQGNPTGTFSNPYIYIIDPEGPNGPNTNYNIVVTTAADLHPNLAVVNTTAVTETYAAQPLLKRIEIEQTLPNGDPIPNGTYYFKVSKVGQNGKCDSALGGLAGLGTAVAFTWPIE